MISQIIGKLIARQDLSSEEMTSALEQIMEGQCTGAQIGAFLATLRSKGESIDEISAAVKVLRSKATPVPLTTAKVIDTCGTGGDHSGSYNISTTSAIIAASAGATVAKHGNKAMSSSCGSANVLQELGLNLDLTADQVGQSIDKHNIGFLFAMKLHNAMRHVGPARQELGQRTIFNILGPMLNPAQAKRQIIGVFDPELLVTIAMVLKNTGSERVLIVHGEDGMDEITLTAKTRVAELKDGEIREYKIDPTELGMSLCSADDLKGGNPKENANIINAILQGEKGPRRDIAVLNAAAALMISDVASNMQQGIQKAEDAIDSGASAKTLEAFVKFSH